MPSINGTIDLAAIAKLVESLGTGNEAASGSGGTSDRFTAQPDAFGSATSGNGPQAKLLREIELLLKLMLELEQSQSGATPFGQQNPSSAYVTPASYGSSASAGPASVQGATGVGNPAAQGAATAGPAGPAPTAGSINERIAQAAQQLCGTSSADGPGGGNVACAFEVNKVLARAGVAPLGDNPNYVPSVEAALEGGRGVQVSAAQAQPGDIAVAGNDHHIGIVTGAGASNILSNSSGQDAFSWQSSGAGFDQYFGAPTRYYRVVN